MFDPIAQKDYYQMRAIFEPHQVRTDRLPGQLDTAKDGLVRVFDTATNNLTYLFIRGDERRPDTNQIMQPGVPVALAAFPSKLEPKPISLPRFAAHPDKRKFVIRDALNAAQAEADWAHQRYEQLAHPPPSGRGDLLNKQIMAGLREQFGKETNSTATDGRQLAEAKTSLAVAEARLTALQ